MITLSIIIPAYNESKRILPTLRDVDHFVRQQKYECEVIVVDDGSNDNTSQLVTDFIQGKPHFQLHVFEHNQGKGKAVQVGMTMAKGAYRLFSDADLSTPIDEVNPLIGWAKPNGAYDVVIGSRRVRGARIGKRQPVFREFSGRIFSLLVRLLVFPGFLDTQCGFKLFTKDAAEKIFNKQTIPGFGFDVEVLYLALKKFNMKVKESAVMWYDAPNTKVRLLQDSTRMFWDLIEIRKKNRQGRYN